MEFTAFPRSVQGSGASRRLRRAGKVPGIVYGVGTPANIELDHNALFHALKNEKFHSSILSMKLDGQTDQVLLRDVQRHAFKAQVMHVDFQRIDSTSRRLKKNPSRVTVTKLTAGSAMRQFCRARSGRTRGRTRRAFPGRRHGVLDAGSAAAGRAGEGRIGA